MPGPRLTALVLTVSDRSAAGERDDTSGEVVAGRLEALGFSVERLVVPDERRRIEAMLVAGATRHPLILTTGGTGLGPRDVTPQATAAVVDFTVPGFAEVMRAEGRRHTPLADLSRATAGVRGRTLIVNLPGSPRGAGESLAAIEPLLIHGLETMAGPFDHEARGAFARDASAQGGSTRSGSTQAGSTPGLSRREAVSRTASPVSPRPSGPASDPAAPGAAAPTPPGRPPAGPTEPGAR